MWQSFLKDYNFLDAGTVRSINAYKESMKGCMDDRTQRLLACYIDETEGLFNKAIRQYDKEGAAFILPSMDLGIPNNLIRLSGGFATGLAVLWNCKMPVVPIDCTVNVCTCSVFEVDGQGYREWFCDRNLLDVHERMLQLGAANAFQNGNHFLQIYFSQKRNRYYLVLHGSAAYLKQGTFGLYPTKHNWYSREILTVQNADGRYLRYILGDTAEHFIWCALQLNRCNTEIHRAYVEQLGAPVKTERSIHHHYGMPSRNSVMIGTYFVDEGSIVPLLTQYKQPIYLIKILESFPHITVEGKNKYIFPHGWGKQFTQALSESARFTVSGERFILHNGAHTKQYRIFADSLAQDTAVRNHAILRRPESFYGQGCIFDVLYPLASYSGHDVRVVYFER